jgi:DNA-binding NtrC family response regulator
LKILCIDDDSTYLALLHRTLQSESSEDMQVFITDDSKKAFDILSEHQIDILLTDLYMPETSGLDILKKTKEISPLTEIIVMSALGSIDSAVEAMKLGARDFIIKPLNVTLIREKLLMVRDFIDRRKEAEDYRHAKEIIESNAQKCVHMMEKIVSGHEENLKKISEIVNSEIDSGEKIEKIRLLLEKFRIQA